MKKAAVIIPIVCVAVVVIVIAALFAFGVFNPSGQNTGSGAADQIVGTWHGTKSVMFGVATADVTAKFNSDMTGKIDGTIDAPSFGFEKVPVSIDFTYEHKGGNAYVMKIGGQDTAVTCDGTTTKIKINPSQIKSDYPSIDIEMDLTRV
ncbi:MAG: hypothetical protein Q4Q53_00535 [Methanocorpusculum sp.]|nr:hypothetical protein [Methanocorpusculum sp.]